MANTMPELLESNIDRQLIRNIAKHYCPLDYRGKLSQLLTLVYPSKSFEGLEKIKLHELVNQIVVGHDSSEQVLKYHLCKHFYQKKVIAAFEVRVNNSRADFLAINGDTKSFEIKSSLDNLYKLRKQTADYILAFEKNYLVVDDRHVESAKQLAPASFGIWTFSKDGAKKIQRNAGTNDKIDAEFQLRLLTKKEIQASFQDQMGSISCILRELCASDINERFKRVLKIRYEKRWSFLLQHKHNILPIDLQFFFNRNIDPYLIYH